ncbi:MAG: hypothetical protein E7510_09410 [Ruminococcus sp.]|nr:hypothetical protein [Ruminococcus sp.]
MDNQIISLMKVASYLSNEQILSELELMRNAMESRLCYISFIGRFSAGKSKLINNLLQLDLLPSGTVETTPVMTYIRYGEPGVVLHLINGEELHKDLECLKYISQRSDLTCDTINYIEVYIEHKLLENGIVLIDTPGLNTTIERHEVLFSDALNISSMVVYVSGHSPSLVDIEKLKIICESKCDFMIVRTHCDEINVSEETFEDAVAADARIFREANIQNKCYYISNEESSQYFENIREIRSFLLKISASSYKQVLLAIDVKCQRIAEECISMIKEQKNMLVAQQHGENERLQLQKKAMEKAIVRIQTQIASLEAEIGFISQKVECDLDSSVRRKIGEIIEKNAESIQVSSPQKPFDVWMKSYLNTRVATTLNEIKCVLSDYYQSKQYQIDFDAEAIHLDVTMANYTSFLDDDVMKIQASDCVLEQKLIRQKEIEQELIDLQHSDDYNTVQQELVTLEQELINCTAQCAEIPPYTPQLIQIDSGKAQPSQIAKTVGNIADWVTLLIPGGQVAGLVSKLGNSGKVVGGVAKVIGKSEKICKIIKNGDTVKDIAFALKNMSKTYATHKRISKAQKCIQTAAKTAQVVSESARTIRENSAEPTIFDYFTISYWAGKLGERFDTPQRYVVDFEYEREYRKAEQEAKQRLAEIRYQEYEKKRQMNLFASRQEQLEAEKRLLIDDVEKIRAETIAREHEIRSKAEKKALVSWRKSIADSFICDMTSLVESLLVRYKRELPELLAESKKQSLSKLYTSLSQQETTLSSIMCKTDTQCEDNISRLDSLLEELSRYGYLQ